MLQHMPTLLGLSLLATMSLYLRIPEHLEVITFITARVSGSDSPGKAAQYGQVHS
jgi:hypothetical protein